MGSIQNIYSNVIRAVLALFLAVFLALSSLYKLPNFFYKKN